MPGHALPVARMALHVVLIHEKGERHLETGVHLAGVERERETGLDPREHRHNAVAERGHVEIEIAERLDELPVEADFLVGFSQGGSERAGVALVDFAARKRHCLLYTSPSPR